MPAPKDLIYFPRSTSSKTDQDSNATGSHVSTKVQYEQSPGLSSTSSGPPARSQGYRRREATDVAAALFNCTTESLQLSPKGLDFGVVKREVEQKLGLSPDFWGKDERDEWFLKSKHIIKMAVVNIPMLTV